MHAAMLGLLAETPIHPGSTQATCSYPMRACCCCRCAV